ncbi:hypothetical protein [Pseudoroseicyclus tamaricis]|uniref:Transferrin-binding protein B C-lobe/N-lobe beta barrel domain-containing protein n=1 Tax=Pseudoroseicyclus tamaricis TaxID=2705421 RepID=A0A6B2K100_9RHOB|nr:hypothetical protein [Pseudoroseicyclus tamaricis]NDV01372.1 hypothetical protein [Pseudoroseicyclus tamaricis]
MTSILRSAAAPLVLLAALGACSSSSGPEGSDLPAFSDFDDALSYAENVISSLDTVEDIYADELPDSGTASYEGFAIVAEADSDAGAIGGVAMELDFGAESLTGRADNFVASDDTPVSGQLDIAGSGIADDYLGAAIGVRVSGSLEGTAGYTHTIDEDVMMAIGADADEDTVLLGETSYDGTSLVTGETVGMDLGIIALEQ